MHCSAVNSDCMGKWRLKRGNGNTITRRKYKLTMVISVGAGGGVDGWWLSCKSCAKAESQHFNKLVI